MIPYKVVLIPDAETKNEIHFESNEKPFKGEVYTIKDVNGKLWDARITEVTKMVVRNKNPEAEIEYRCKVEKHEATGSVIGFGKRT
jgi:hypothetical protein